MGGKTGTKRRKRALTGLALVIISLGVGCHASGTADDHKGDVRIDGK